MTRRGQVIDENALTDEHIARKIMLRIKELKEDGMNPVTIGLIFAEYEERTIKRALVAGKPAAIFIFDDNSYCIVSVGPMKDGEEFRLEIGWAENLPVSNRTH